MTEEGGNENFKKAGPHRVWTDEEKRWLHWWWGGMSLAKIAKKLGRTPSSVRYQARRLGLGPAKRGTYSLVQVARMTGYDKGRIITVARRAGIHLPRQPRTRNPNSRSKNATAYKGRHYAIPHETMERLMDELKKYKDGARVWRTHAREWGGSFRDGSPKPNQCLGCNSNERAHRGKGYCTACYPRAEGEVAWDAPRRRPRRK